MTTEARPAATPTAPTAPDATPTDFGWLRKLHPIKPGVFAARVEWQCPTGVPDSFSIYANRNGFGMCGAFFGHKGHAPNIAALLLLACSVSEQLNRGVTLDNLDFTPTAPTCKEPTA